MNQKLPVAVIGSGISGLCSAIFLSKLYKTKVDLYTESFLGKSSSIMAQSGFRAGAGKNGEIIFTEMLTKNLEIYFEKWLIKLLNFLPLAIDCIGIDLSKMDISNNHIDNLIGIPMYSFNKKNIGNELVKYLIKIIKDEPSISVFENTLIELVPNYEGKIVKDYSVHAKTKKGGIKQLINDNYILAIGGDVGNKFYGLSSNMTYESYNIHNQIFINNESRAVQFHPFGIKKSNNVSPSICLPEIMTKGGILFTDNLKNKVEINNFKSRKECVIWMQKFDEKIYFIPSKNNKNLIEKKYGRFFKKIENLGEVLEVIPIAHYLLNSDYKKIEGFITVGECKTNGFKLDRPAGMGITQSFITAYDAALKIHQRN